ncbi:hypothetical protein OIDMADRAFT_138250 [Oidiodendron maius Zn]|uniref:PNPLA domain-containing protein n=1 Tax=Oidiodendron maius (strain Zn) TaxID=913774 RepID=A0A0C3CU21_OIDMZ|nr:hypothetical protein OIDMADRAFT_138250 [Oidiodendron maius Zn]
MERATATEQGGEPNPLDTTGLCLLSLDGGGVRGLSTLYILKIIMDRLNHDRRAAALQPVRPCEVFDLIGGTSTGGLIAIMLGRLEMDVDECIAAYSELAAAVFSQKSSRIPFNIKGKIQERFDSAKLESAIRKARGQSSDHISFVCTADRNTKNIVRLRSYTLPDEPNIRATICQAALATSAATTFFDPVSIGDRSFADAALGANNPVDEVEGEASNIWCSETGDLKRLVKCFLSVGTGNPGKKPFENSLIRFLGETVVQIATETTNTEKKFIARWAKHFDEKRYFRFDVEQGLQDIGLDEYKKKGAIEGATEGYLIHIAQKFRVRDCIQNLRLKQKKPDTSFDAIIKEYTERTIRQHPGDAPWIVPFDRNHCFTGRESQLSQLQDMLFIKDQTTKIAVTGLGGVGKTQLVLELIYRIREEHRECSIIWIPAIHIENLQQAYRDVGQRLGIPGWEDNKSDIKKLVKEYLSKESAGQWVLVFDNADDIDMWIKNPENGSLPLIDYLPRSKRGCIIFTTRDRKTAVKLANQNIVEALAMSEETAKDILQNYLVNKGLLDNETDTKVLLGQLTYLPLAIVQAAAYINENGILLADYLLLLEDQEEEVIDLLSEEFEDSGRYRNVKNPVATTWLISFERIRLRDPLAAEFLSFMACIDPKSVPPSLLPPGPSRKKEVDAIGTLDAYSFITRRSGGLAFDIHRLVHLATRGWLRKEEVLAQWTERAIARLEDVFPDNDHQNRSVWRRYLAHASYALKPNLLEKCSGYRINLARKLGMCFYSDGRFNEAEGLFVQVMKSTKRELGIEHPSTLTIMNNLASTYQSQANLATIFRNQGRWKEAEDLEVQVMEIRKKVLGAEHPDTLRIMNDLVLTLGNQGRWKEAEDLHVQVIETTKRVLGTEHPDTLTSMYSLASMFRNQGRWNEAEELLAQVMEMRKRVLGVEHPSTLIIMNNLALIFWNQGRWKEAEKLNVQAGETRKRVLGVDHPDTLTSMANLAFTWERQGRDTEALELMEECIQLRTRVLGIHHPDTVSSLTALTCWQTEKLNIGAENEE